MLRPHTIHENRIPSARKRPTIHDLTNPMDATASILVSHDIYIESNHYDRDNTDKQILTPSKMKAKYSGASSPSCYFAADSVENSGKTQQAQRKLFEVTTSGADFKPSDPHSKTHHNLTVGRNTPNPHHRQHQIHGGSSRPITTVAHSPSGKNSVDAASQSLTYIKSRLQPQILSQLLEVENLSHHSFKKVYEVRKEAANTQSRTRKVFHKYYQPASFSKKKNRRLE